MTQLKLLLFLVKLIFVRSTQFTNKNQQTKTSRLADFQHFIRGTQFTNKNQQTKTSRSADFQHFIRGTQFTNKNQQTKTSRLADFRPLIKISVFSAFVRNRFVVYEYMEPDCAIHTRHDLHDSVLCKSVYISGL